MTLETALRPFWLPNLNEVTSTSSGFKEWLASGNYGMHSPIAPDRFELFVGLGPAAAILQAYATDCDKFVSAAFESMVAVPRSPPLPKSVAWLMISHYYAAFFAANAILRMLGTSCTQIETIEANSVLNVAHVWGQNPGAVLLNRGQYSCTFDHTRQMITCSLVRTTAGVHEGLWRLFRERMEWISNQILASSSNISIEAQRAAAKLYDLCQNLSRPPCGTGNWLSYVRNRINYRQEYDAWFPYGRNDAERLFRGATDWMLEPLSLNLSPGSRELEVYSVTCCFVVALCRAMALDIADRSPSRKSFLTRRSLRLLRTVEPTFTEARGA